MKKIKFLMLLTFAVSSIAYATGKADGGKTKAKIKATEKKCTMGGDCCKKSSRAAMLKAKPAAKKA